MIRMCSDERWKDTVVQKEIEYNLFYKFSVNSDVFLFVYLSCLFQREGGNQAHWHRLTSLT